MITFSNKTNNGNFSYVNEIQEIAINGSYSLDINNNLVSINFSFGELNSNMNNSLNGYNNGNGSLSFSINCNDLVLLAKVLNVYDDVVDSIKNNNLNEQEE